MRDSRFCSVLSRGFTSGACDGCVPRCYLCQHGRKTGHSILVVQRQGLYVEMETALPTLLFGALGRSVVDDFTYKMAPLLGGMVKLLPSRVK